MKKKICFIIGLSMIFFLASCGTSTGDKTDTVNVSQDMNLASTLSDMVNDADLVVLGSYEGFDRTWNEKRNPDNITEGSNEQYAEGKIYDFKIDEILKGQTNDKIIKISHTHMNTLYAEDSSSVNSDKIDYKDPTFIEPNYEDQYIAFLSENKELNVYGQPIEPFLIKFDDKIAHLETNLNDESTFSKEVDLGNGTILTINNEIGELDKNLNDSISNKTLNDIKKEIKKIIQKLN